MLIGQSFADRIRYAQLSRFGVSPGSGPGLGPALTAVATTHLGELRLSRLPLFTVTHLHKLSIASAMQPQFNPSILPAHAPLQQSMFDYFESTRSAQVQRSIGVDTPDEYIDRRARNIASYLCLTLMPWTYGLTLPSWIWDTESMQRINREVAIGVCLCNDIVSL
jgi:hypothetical protein